MIQPRQRIPREFLPFEDAREYVKALGLKGKNEWCTYCKSGQRPSMIPSNPNQVYKSQFQGYGDWLGTGTIALFNREYLSFDEARAYVQTLGLKSKDEWVAYCKSGKKPTTLPSDPSGVYKAQWQSWGDWLGTSTIATQDRQYLPFEEAREWIRVLGLKSDQEWRVYCKSGQKPANIPARPDRTYAAKFQGYGDWLGTDTIATNLREYLSFDEARAFVRTLGLKNREEWSNYCKSRGKFANIPQDPHHVYKTQWQSWGDWLGTGTIANQYRRVSREQKRIQMRAIKRRRRAHKKGVLGTHTAQQIQEQLGRQHYRCYYAACGYAKFEKLNGKYIYHVDHTFPLSRVAGTDIPANDISYLVLACPACNWEKNDKFPWEWPRGGRLL